MAGCTHSMKCVKSKLGKEVETEKHYRITDFTWMFSIHLQGSTDFDSMATLREEVNSPEILYLQYKDYSFSVWCLV